MKDNEGYRNRNKTNENQKPPMWLEPGYSTEENPWNRASTDCYKASIDV